MHFLSKIIHQDLWAPVEAHSGEAYLGRLNA
jgi:hypothetical protein